MTKYLLLMVVVFTLFIACGNDKQVAGDDEDGIGRNCTLDSHCPTDWHCDKNLGDCNGFGYCNPPHPNDCYALAAPVCGCDGITYDNDCHAHVAGVNIAYMSGCGDFQDAEETIDEDVVDISPQTDNDEECPGGIINADCALRGGACSGDPYTLSQCEGDMMNYCDRPHNPCWTGSWQYTENCAETGGRCFNIEEYGCGARCLPFSDFVPAAPFEGEWREIGVIECDSGQTLAAVPQSIASLSFPAPNEFHVRWQGDDQTYTGVYENSEVEISYAYLTTRWSFNAPYPVTSFCDYLFSSDGQTMTMTLTNNASSLDCLFYNGIWYIDDISYCGHIFERIPDEQPDDDTLLTDVN